MVTFLDLTRELATDEAAKAEFGADASGFLAARGWAGLDEAELGDALGHAVDALPSATAAQLPSAEALASGEVTADTALKRLAEADPPAEERPDEAVAPETSDDPEELEHDPIELDTTYEIDDSMPDWAEDAMDDHDGLEGLDGMGNDGIDGPPTDHGDAFDLG